MYDATVIVAFYNNVDALRCIIRALEKQPEHFEIMIADDGSTQENVDLVKALIANSHKKITHVWQEDKGFRKNRLLNKCIHAAQSPYMIFLDGDCIPQEHFVFDHLKNKEEHTFLNGRRVNIHADVKHDLYRDANPHRFFVSNMIRLFVRYLIGYGKHIEKGVRITASWLASYINRRERGLLGCNFSAWKADLIAINGFDNRYETPGTGEDTDLEFRLLGAGMKKKNILHQAVVLHIMHPRLKLGPESGLIFSETRKHNQIIATDGYAQAYQKD
ncbi:putative glycosyl transferase [Vibrio aerogenes CECT 7868]|uniref:Putative glycosyl transferase n=1 Tax=Vibrio aerogenes CECT 7868 TaxID=1216006 RepID=A0A1M5VN38_9VIBR|nr:glycosyltransferase [Vibrio aerogenes]SHH76676.1 putative glycosyl transferase [Vibrio aerogenes CECT 7868]